MISWPLVRYVLTASIRDRLILSFLVLMAVGVSLAIFLGSAAVIEADQFAVVFAAGGLRLAGAIGLVLFVVFHLRRSFETRDVDYLLSRPISRPAFLLSHALAFTILAAIVSLFVALAVYAVAPHTVGSGFLLWSFSLFAEYLILVNVALFFAMVLPSAAVGALAIMAFYVLSRLIGQILGIVKANLLDEKFEFLSQIMQFISLIIPRFDLLAQTSWLVYGETNIGFGFIIGQAVIFTALILFAALIDLRRRQF